jgi:hypothetical protein
MKIHSTVGAHVEINGKPIEELTDEQLTGLIGWVMTKAEWQESDKEALRRVKRQFVKNLAVWVGNYAGYSEYELILPDDFYLYSLLRDGGDIIFSDK